VVDIVALLPVPVHLVLQLYFWACTPFVVPILGDALMPAAPRRPGENPFHFLLRGQYKTPEETTNHADTQRHASPRVALHAAKLLGVGGRSVFWLLRWQVGGPQHRQQRIRPRPLQQQQRHVLASLTAAYAAALRGDAAPSLLPISKCVKQHLGFEAVATHGFDAVIAHVHWVYCAYLLLHMAPLGLSPGAQSIGDKQRALQQGLADQEKRHILQKLTQIGGVQRYKDELRQALASN